jgi:hypothetical protein
MKTVRTILLACACGVLRGQDAASFSGLDAEAALRIAATIPLLTVNLNNYKHPANPILTAGPKGAWDEDGIERVAVLRLAANDWRMWYSCTGTHRAIGLATSKDGVTWTKHAGNPVFRPEEPWEGTFLSPTSVLQVNGRFYLYYWAPGHVFPDPATGKLPKPPMKYIGLVTSEDGIRWTRQGSVDGNKGAVLGPNPPGINEHAEAGGSGVDAAKVFYFPEEKKTPWRMVYTAFGLHGQWNGLAESEDGVGWRRTRAPVAVHSGFYTRATANHHDSGQTIRGPVRIGSVWAGLSFELDTRDSAPAVGVALDRWYTLGQRTFYRNQDYETGGLHPWVIEADEEWYYLFYSTGRRATGLIRAPKRSAYQPVVIWQNHAATKAGMDSKIIEPDRLRFQAYFQTDQPGLLEVFVWSPAVAQWVVLETANVSPGGLHRPPSPTGHAKMRWRFTTKSSATVNAWLVPE